MKTFGNDYNLVKKARTAKIETWEARGGVKGDFKLS
jgi:hypothetical protein